MLVRRVTDIEMQNIAAGGTSEVGSVHPVKDFNDMVTRRDVDLVEKGIEIHLVILSLFDSFSHLVLLSSLYQTLRVAYHSISNQANARSNSCVRK